MSPENIPAWKRLGLKVKKTQSEDPLSLPTHLQDSSITKKQVKSIKKTSTKRSLESESQKLKKPPKRIKLPKNERPPPPEKDQLVYLKEYTDNKDRWKFSKQKQNWLIKNVLNILEEYLNYIFNYFKSIQGGSKLRIERELKGVIDEWNEYAGSVHLQSEQNSESGEKILENEDKDENKEVQDNTKKKEKPFSYTIEQVIRAQKVFEIITGIKLVLSSLDDLQMNSSGINTDEAVTLQNENCQKKAEHIDTDLDNAYSGKQLELIIIEHKKNGQQKEESEDIANEENPKDLEAETQKELQKEKKMERKEGKRKSKDKKKRRKEKESHENDSLLNSLEIQSNDTNDNNCEEINSSRNSNLIIEDVNINDYI